ncbi:uncharacterized protein LOC125859152, partial [Solanum stenotomum]|uniref:uncharacterized protein LOC125859152 n=1 Tax=Solanum stenotomum TaxID=172797 RepID=UPI0020D0D5FB
KMCSKKLRLSDGRNLAYKERGVAKEKSNYRIIIVHGFNSSKESEFLAPQEMMNKMGIYVVQYDRAGYGESDPNPKRSQRSEACDIEELADHLQLGSKFYIISNSMGSYPTWSCIKHISQRLAGVAFVVPIVNYQWPSLPLNLIEDDKRKKNYWWMMFLARYVPRSLLHWLVIAKSSTSSSTKNVPEFEMEKLRSRSDFDNLCNDFLVAFSKWDFDPLELISCPILENGQTLKKFVDINKKSYWTALSKLGVGPCDLGEGLDFMDPRVEETASGWLHRATIASRSSRSSQ